ncbi:GntR family transcriptional regulator [Antribacter gilvus]|uniref:GntR family transcriptional regulator n=1 Tax=Antribacter gilvus TaxID=2304675 RepID=UPI000F77AFE8|nr:GntR family transcriptional regulator [Antribacter gilvus]
MIFRIDTASDEPLFEQLVSRVRLGIARGELRAGERLPPARELGTALDMNVHTVLHAYQVLRDEGLIELRRGRGAVVTGPAKADLSAVERALETLVQAAREARLSPEATTTLLKEAMKR